MSDISKDSVVGNLPALSITKAMGEEPLLNAGNAVRVLNRQPVGHYRVPHFVRGKRGRVERVIEPRAINNEEEGFGRNTGIKGYYYRVAIPLTELWPDYTGSPQDGLRIEIFETWLESI